VFIVDPALVKKDEIALLVDFAEDNMKALTVLSLVTGISGPPAI
jgi:hypothetical protein